MMSPNDVRSIGFENKIVWALIKIQLDIICVMRLILPYTRVIVSVTLAQSDCDSIGLRIYCPAF